MTARRLIAVALTAVLAAGCGKTTLDDHDPSVSGAGWDFAGIGRRTKLDLLFVIDNSISMGDKQEAVARSVPQLVRRFAAPRCFAGANAPNGESFPCEHGGPEIPPILDIHVGVISTSLGGHGGVICSPAVAGYQPQQNDHAHLLPTVRPQLAGHPAVLSYDPTGLYGPPAGIDELTDELATQIRAAGTSGCGFEAPMEAWYRFLVDPEPPLSVVRDGNEVRVEAIDTELLAQRAEFLRDDSLVTIVMLSDENDCSIRDQGDAWKVAQEQPLPRGRSACAVDPDSKCCRPCDAEDIPGCTPALLDSQCWQEPNGDDDSPNLRCWDQKRRFGVDWLWPVSRYVDAIEKPTITDRDGVPIDNPLFAGGRSLGSVSLVSIAGVPWQLIATEDSKTDPSTLEYRNSYHADWDEVLSEPHMVESVEPRLSVPPPWSPLTGDDDIVGHDRDNLFDDLQYACTFPLPEPKPAVLNAPTGNHDPLFRDPVSGDYGTTQYRAAAYPALRQLALTTELEDGSASVASACPKTLAGDPSSTAFGYNAAFDLSVDRLKEPDVFPWVCRKQPLAVQDGDVAQCRVLEVREGSGCDCSGTGRAPVSTDLLDGAAASLEKHGFCSDGGCNTYCGCELVQVTGDAAAGCRGLEPGYVPELAPPGWCFVDEALGIGEETYCASGRSIRFAGYDVPANDAWVAVYCD